MFTNTLLCQTTNTLLCQTTNTHMTCTMMSRTKTWRIYNADV